MKEAAATAMGGGDRDLKMKDVVVAVGEDGRDDLKTAKMKDAAGESSEGGGGTLKRKEAGRRPWEEGGILKLKKEALAAMDRWYRTVAPAMMARKDAQRKAEQEKAQAALGAPKKKMKVIKSKYPKQLIDHWAACPFTICGEDLSDEELAQRSPESRQAYGTVKLFETKNRREYWDALIAQQEELGYAEDEIEVTDDDEEEEMVEN